MTVLGQYQSQQTRALASIDSTKYPDTNKDMEANMRRLNEFVDYLAQYVGQMQKGVDQANQDPISKIRDMISGFGILLGGGFINQIADINFGDMQYYLPAIGALLGFDSTTPFPINLFNAAEHFLLGYIVPLDSFLIAIEDIILSWLTTFGIDEDAIHSIRQLLDAIIAISSDFFGLFNTIAGVLDIFGLGDIGPFGDLWHAVTQLFGGFGLQTIGTIIDPIFHTLAPWISEAAQFIHMLDLFIKQFTGGVTDLTGVLNFAGMFTSWINFFPGGGGIAFDPFTGWATLVSEVLSTILGSVFSLNAAKLFGQLPAGVLSMFGIGSSSPTEPNMLANGTFLSPEAINDPTGNWTFDGTKSPASSSGGSVKVIGNGTLKVLTSNMIDVAKNDIVNLSVQVSWASAAGTGTPIQMRLAKYVNGAKNGASDVIAQIPSLTANSGFITLSYQYTVPTSPAIDRIAIELVVTNNLTTGIVNFADGKFTKTGLLPTALVTNLPGQLGGITNMLNLSSITDLIGLNATTGWTSIITSLINPLGLLGQLSGGKLLDIQSPQILQDFMDAGYHAVTGILSVGVSVVDFFSALFGLRTDTNTNTTGLSSLTYNLLHTAGTVVSSAVDVFGSSLQSVLDLFAFLFSGSQINGANIGTFSILDSVWRGFYAILANSPFNYTNLTREATENYQTKSLLGGTVLTPINSFIQSIYNWWHAHF